MKAKRVVLMAVAALPLAAPLARPVPPARAGADSCAPAPLPGLDSLVAEGRYWHAWRALPALPRDRRPLGTSDALLRLRIAEGLQRWPEVDTVLARAQGVDTIPELLAGAARQAERSEHWATAAARYRRLESLPSARPVVRAAAAVRLAVAEERLALRDSAAAAWRRAAHALPDLADWFALQRAEFEADTAAAFASVAVVRSPGAAETADDFVARRRIEAGNMRGALELYLRRGRVLDAARVEVMLGKDDVARRRADALLADPSRPVALLAANFLVAQLGTPTPDELLGIARAFRARGDLLSAERYLRRATAPADAGVAAWLELASVAAARHRLPAARAALDGAKALLQRRGGAPATVLAPVAVQVLGAAGRWDDADSLVARLARANPGDGNVADAVLLLANHERFQDARAAELGWCEVLVRRFAATPAANLARFRLALALYAAGSKDSAAAGLAEALARDTAHRLGAAPRYWAARIALERRAAGATDTLRAIAAEDPTSYYGVRAAELVGDTLAIAPDSTLPPGRAQSFSPERAAERISMLVAVGLPGEARAEALAWMRDSSASPQLLAAAASAAAEADFAQEAIFLGGAARTRGGISAGVAGALFPLPYRATIEAEAAEHCVDPMLLAAIVRQESRFQPQAKSRAGARGLSQLLPQTARQMSRREGVRSWDPALLYVPDFNLHFGARYVRDRLMRGAFPAHAVIASYDAGPTRLARWQQWPEFADPDLFIERLSITETRDYVRSVYANYAWYRRVYAPASGASR